MDRPELCLPLSLGVDLVPSLCVECFLFINVVIKCAIFCIDVLVASVAP